MTDKEKIADAANNVENKYIKNIPENFWFLRFLDQYMLLYHRDFFEHLHQKHLVLDNKIPFPISTWERSYRYKGYGYNLCRESKKKLLDAIRNTTPKDDELSMYNIGGWD